MADPSTTSQLTGPDPFWNGLYRAGGICAVLYVLLGVVIPTVQVMIGCAVLADPAGARVGLMTPLRKVGV